MKMYCPHCKKDSLVSHRVKDRDVTVEYCKDCRGIWFDGREMEQMIDVASVELAIPDGAKPVNRVCPKCHVPMQAFNYPQTFVKVEMCPTCIGLWLDGGELKEIQMMRSRLEREGELETHADIPGIKGKIIRAMNSAIASLSTFN